jgi:hypothetical protein
MVATRCVMQLIHGSVSFVVIVIVVIKLVVACNIHQPRETI